jgi:hypothetical protein
VNGQSSTLGRNSFEYESALQTCFQSAFGFPNY